VPAISGTIFRGLGTCPSAPKKSSLIDGLRGTPTSKTVNVNGVEVKDFAPLFEWSGVGHPFEPTTTERFFGVVGCACPKPILGTECPTGKFSSRRKTAMEWLARGAFLSQFLFGRAKRNWPGGGRLPKVYIWSPLLRDAGKAPATLVLK